MHGSIHHSQCIYNCTQEIWEADSENIEIGAGTAIPTIRQDWQHIAGTTRAAKLIRINPIDFYLNKTYGWSIALGGLDGIKQICR